MRAAALGLMGAIVVDTFGQHIPMEKVNWTAFPCLGPPHIPARHPLLE
jgi:hypothetical protein